jgi:hypothetical protein
MDIDDLRRLVHTNVHTDFFGAETLVSSVVRVMDPFSDTNIRVHFLEAVQRIQAAIDSLSLPPSASMAIAALGRLEEQGSA